MLTDTMKLAESKQGAERLEDFRKHDEAQRTDGILKIIQERKSARLPFDPGRPISEEDLEQILEAARWAPTAHNMQNFEIIVVDDKEQLETIGKIKSQVSETFLRENYQQMSFSEEELRKRKVGVLAGMFPPSWRRPDAQVDSADSMAHSFLGGILQHAPMLLIVVYDSTKRAPASEGDVLGMISLGCVMENMWLMAESLGIGFHIVSALSSEAVEKDLRPLLNLPPQIKIAFACRLGYPTAEQVGYIRVRRDISDFTHKNRFDR